MSKYPVSILPRAEALELVHSLSSEVVGPLSDLYDQSSYDQSSQAANKSDNPIPSIQFMPGGALGPTLTPGLLGGADVVLVRATDHRVRVRNPWLAGVHNGQHFAGMMATHRVLNDPRDFTERSTFALRRDLDGLISIANALGIE